MKKWVSLWLALVMVLSATSLTLAAVDVGGNLRVWYQTAEKSDVDSDGFKFDRLALVFRAPTSDISGLSSELRFRFTGNEAVSLENTTDELTIGSKIFVQSAYYYQKDVLNANDELDIGYFPIDFANGNYNGIIVGSVADGFLAPDNHLGVKYTYNTGKFQGIVGFVNATNYDPGKNDGYDWTLRATYQPVEVLTLGFGAARDANESSESDKFTVDAYYKQGPWALLAEYAYQNLDGVSSASDPEGSFVEAAYTFNPKLTSYLGVSVDAEEITTNDYYYIGSTYLLTEKTKLTGEYIHYENNDYILGVRFRVDF